MFSGDGSISHLVTTSPTHRGSIANRFPVPSRLRQLTASQLVPLRGARRLPAFFRQSPTGRSMERRAGGSSRRSAAKPRRCGSPPEARFRRSGGAGGEGEPTEGRTKPQVRSNGARMEVRSFRPKEDGLRLRESHDSDRTTRGSVTMSTKHDGRE